MLFSDLRLLYEKKEKKGVKELEMVGFRKDRIDIWSANPVAMQPLVLSVTLVSAWSRSDGYAHINVYTHAHRQASTCRHAHLHVLTVAVLSSLQTITLTLSQTRAFAYKSPQVFYKPSRRGQNAVECLGQALDMMMPVQIPPV